MRKEEKRVIRAERALIDAVMGKPWKLLATWMLVPFPLEHINIIISDVNKVDFACRNLVAERAALQSRRRRK